MREDLPLSMLLSQALVAYTIEMDNEFEHRMPHRTARFSATSDERGPWLVSLVMWENCLHYLTEERMTVGELRRASRLSTNLDGMRRWGYIIIETDTSSSTSKKPRANAVLRLTPSGKRAQEVWRPLFGAMEQRWRRRFGEEEIEQLRQSLWGIASHVTYDLPDCLPILCYGLFTRGRQPGHERDLAQQGDHVRQAPATPTTADGSDLPLCALLYRVLLVFAVEFERESKVSLAVSANALRVVDGHGVQVRELSRLSGISREGMIMALKFLEDRELAVVEPNPFGSRYKVARLTPKGLEARETYYQLVAAIKQRWRVRYGEQAITRLCEALEQLVGAPDAESPLLQGLQPYPDNWRAKVARPEILPHYPMVLYRGGYPDGA